jgi:uncharacterized membrane protein YgcG
LNNPSQRAATEPAGSPYTVEYASTQSGSGWSGLFKGIGIIIFAALLGVGFYFVLMRLFGDKNETGNAWRSGAPMFFRRNNNVTSADDSPVHDSGSNNDWSTNDNAAAAVSSFDSTPSSSSSIDSSPSGGGISDGGGASGSW